MAGNQSFYIDLTLKSKLLLLESSVSDFTPLKLQAQTSTSIVRLMMQNSDASRFMSLVWDSAGGAEVLNIVGDSQTPAQFFRTGNVTLTSSTTNSVNVKGNTLLLNSNAVAAQTTAINMGGDDGVMILSAQNGFGGTAAQLRLFGPAHATAPSDVRFRQNGVDSFQITGSTRRMTLGVSGDTNQHQIFGSFDSINPSAAGVEWKFAKDTNAGDSTNIAQIAVGNNGTNQGRARLSYTNAAATGSPSAAFHFDPRNNANTTNVNVGRLNFSKVAGNDGGQLLLQTSTTAGTLTTALSINEAQLLTLGAASTDLEHQLNGGFQFTTNNSGLGINGAPSATNILNIRRDQNALTRNIFRNTHTGSSAVIRVSLAADSGDVDWSATSIAAGATASISAGSGFTGGFNIAIGGNNPLSFSTNGTQQLSILGNGNARFATALFIGNGGSGNFSGATGVSQTFTPNVWSSTSTANSIIGVGAHVQDGTNNKRIAMFADHLNQSTGLTYAASSGAPTFNIVDGFNAVNRFSISGAGIITVGGAGLTQTHLVRSRGFATTDAPSGVGTGFSAVHDSNTAGSDAVFAAQVAGSTAGDAVMAFIVAGQNSFTMGIDNSDSDAFKLSLGSVLGSTDYLRVSTIGAFTIGASGNSNQHNVNGSVRITNVSGPILELLDGGTFASNADPFISFRDSSVEGGRVGFDNATTSTLNIRNLISGGRISFSTNQLQPAFTIADSTTGHDTNYAQLTQTLRIGNANIFIGRSATEYGYVGFNARTKSGANSYDYETGDTASIIQFNDGGFSFRGTSTVGTTGTAITFVENMRLNKNGVLMVGTTTAATTTPYIDFVRGTAGNATGVGHLRLSDITTNATGKQAAISWRHTTNAEEDHAMLYGTGSDLYLGGGVSTLNAVSTLRFYTGTTSTTTTGSEAMRISSGQDLFLGATGNQGGHTKERFVVFTLSGASAAGDSFANIANFLDINTTNAMTSGTNSAAGYFSLRRNLQSNTITDTSSGGLSAIWAELRAVVNSTFTYTNATTAGLATIRVSGSILSGGGIFAVTNYHGIRIDSDTGATGTNKFGLWVGDMSGATNNWSIFTTTVGSVRLGNTLRVGNITGVLSLDNEQVSVRRLLSAGDLALGNIAGQFEYNNNNDAGISVGATQSTLGAIFRRTISTSVTDSSSANYSTIGGSFVFNVASAQTYTNAASIFAVILAGSPGNSGAGALAISNYAGVYVSSSSLATGTNKYGIRIDAQSGASNNWGLYQSGSTQLNRFEGFLAVGPSEADSVNIGYFRRDQNALTVLRVDNNNSGASAAAVLRLISNADTFNIYANSTSSPSVDITANSGFTNGIRFSTIGSNPIAIRTNSIDRIYVSGAGDIRMRTDAGIGAYYFTDEHLTVLEDTVNFNNDTCAQLVRLNMINDGWSSGKSVNALSVQTLRQIATTTTDLSGWQILTANAYFNIASSQTYTNTTSAGIASVFVQLPNNSGAGTLAITESKGIWINTNSTNTGTNKYGIIVDDLSGSTNNYSIYTGTAKSSFGSAIATRKGSDFTSVATTATFPSAQGYYRVVGSTAMAIQGITAGLDGQIIRIYNNSGQNLTFNHNNGSASANDRINTITGADVSTTGDGFAELIYDITQQRWVLAYVTP